MVWWIEERGSSFYSNGARPWCCGEVSHGDGVWSCEGAREWASTVGDVKAVT